MPTTPTFNLPYPSSGDPVNIPSDIQALAEGVDTDLVSLNTTFSASISQVTSDVNNILDVELKREPLVDVAHSSNAVTLDATLGNVFFLTNTPTANLTANITNASTTDGKVFTINLIVTQGATGYYPATLNINGSGATIRWPANVVPTPTSSSGKIDVFTFVILRRSAAFTVLGSYNINF